MRNCSEWTWRSVKPRTRDTGWRKNLRSTLSSVDSRSLRMPSRSRTTKVRITRTHWLSHIQQENTVALWSLALSRLMTSWVAQKLSYRTSQQWALSSGRPTEEAQHQLVPSVNQPRKAVKARVNNIKAVALIMQPVRSSEEHLWASDSHTPYKTNTIKIYKFGLSLNINYHLLVSSLRFSVLLMIRASHLSNRSLLHLS